MTLKSHSDETPLTGERLVATRIADHARWVIVVRAALAAGGSRFQAAKLLGVRLPTVTRWVRQEPALVEGIEMRGPGRPRGTKNRATRS